MIVAQSSFTLGCTPTANRCPTLRMKKLNWQKLRSVTGEWLNHSCEDANRFCNLSFMLEKKPIVARCQRC